MPSRATSNGLALRKVIATSGIASWLTWVPNWLIVSPTHSFRKLGWWKRLGRAVGSGIGLV